MQIIHWNSDCQRAHEAVLVSNCQNFAFAPLLVDPVLHMLTNDNRTDPAQ